MWLGNKSSVTVIIITYQIFNMYFHLILTTISKVGTVIVSILELVVRIKWKYMLNIWYVIIMTVTEDLLPNHIF